MGNVVCTKTKNLVQLIFDDEDEEAMNVISASSKKVNKMYHIADDDLGHECSPLQIACKMGKYDIVNHLLENGANVDALDGCHRTSLIHAVLGGYEEICKALLLKGANPNFFNPVFVCVQRDYAEIFKLLVRAGCKLNLEDMIYMSCLSGSTKVLIELIKSKPNVNLNYSRVKDEWDVLDDDGDDENDIDENSDDDEENQRKFGVDNSLMEKDISFIENNEDQEKMKKKLGASNVCLSKNPMYWGVRKNHVDIVNCLISLPHMLLTGEDMVEEIPKIDVNLKKSLHHACYNGNFEIVRVLLLYKHDVEYKSPLFVACRRGFVEIAEELIKAGANVNGTDDNRIPLFGSVKNGHFKCVHMLMQNDVDLDKKGVGGNTALHYLATGKKNFCWELFNLLLAHGADPNIQNDEGNAPVHVMALSPFKQSVNLMKSLMAKEKIDNSVKNDEGKTPLDLAFNDYKRDLIENWGVKTVLAGLDDGEKVFDGLTDHKKGGEKDDDDEDISFDGLDNWKELKRIHEKNLKVENSALKRTISPVIPLVESFSEGLGIFDMFKAVRSPSKENLSSMTESTICGRDRLESDGIGIEPYDDDNESEDTYVVELPTILSDEIERDILPENEIEIEKEHDEPLEVVEDEKNNGDGEWNEEEEKFSSSDEDGEIEEENLESAIETNEDDLDINNVEEENFGSEDVNDEDVEKNVTDDDDDEFGEATKGIENNE